MITEHNKYEPYIYFFEQELENYSMDVRMGDIDPSYGAPTLATAADSLSQAPLDVVFEWLNYDPDFDGIDVLVGRLTSFAMLAANEPNELLAEIVESHYDKEDRL